VVQKNQKVQALKELPLLSDTPLQKREALFKQKLQLCCVVFNFDDVESDVKGKEIKRETLVELAEYVNTPVGQKILVEGLMPDIVELVRANIFRTLPPQAVRCSF
jgi:serine/threonine-protein phosphatase 2A regulatory subunit B'